MPKQDFNKEADDLKHAHIAGALDRIEKTGEKTALAVAYTNGKVKRLILAVIGIGGYLAGTGFVEIEKLLSLFV